jgi:hypothetical protein
MLHGIAGVRDEVQQELFQLNPVPGDLREIRRQIDAHRDLARDENAVCKLDHLADHAVEVDDAEFGLALLHQQLEVIDDETGALGGVGYVHERRSDLRRIHGIMSKKEHCRLRIVPDRYQRLGQLVGQRAPERRERSHRLRCVSWSRCSRASDSARRCALMSRTTLMTHGAP